MQKRTLRKYICWQRAHGCGEAQRSAVHAKAWKGAVEVIAAGIEPLEFHRQMDKKMRFDIVTLDADAKHQHNRQASTGSSRD